MVEDPVPPVPDKHFPKLLICPAFIDCLMIETDRKENISFINLPTIYYRIRMAMRVIQCHLRFLDCITNYAKERKFEY